MQEGCDVPFGKKKYVLGMLCFGMFYSVVGCELNINESTIHIK